MLALKNEKPNKTKQNKKNCHPGTFQFTVKMIDFSHLRNLD